MKRTTIFVPEGLERDLQLFARRAGKPTAAVVREALAAYLAERAGSDGLPSFAASFDSGRSDTAERHDEILFRNLAPHGAAGAARPRPAPKRRPRAVRSRAASGRRRS
jgi:predicted transcriptional regulator